MKKALFVIALSLGCFFSFTYIGFTQETLEYIVSSLPEDNLIQNPWFRLRDQPSLHNWIDATLLEGGWGASQKPGNPSPDKVVGTAARISTGRGADLNGWSVDPGIDTYLYQVVPADPGKKTLKFDMYWVTHTVDPVTVTVFGGLSPAGPWTEVWKPFHQVFSKVLIPPSRVAQDLWQYYSSITELVTETVEKGYPYYKLEIHARLPNLQGGLKITGVYFSVE